jgi:RNA polymerase sigma-70 factor, ECF subfamily
MIMTTTDLKSIARRSQLLDDEAELVAKSKRDPGEFAVLYDRYVQPIYRYLYYRTSSPAEAEDLTSQTFLTALEALPRYQHQGRFAAWLFRIARGKVIDHARRQKKQAPLLDSYPADTSDPLAQVADADEISRLATLIRGLDEAEQELIHLRYTAGLPFAHIADILGSNENTVKKSLYRIMARLQSHLEDFHG